jgi:hypothetical protein
MESKEGGDKAAGESPRMLRLDNLQSKLVLLDRECPGTYVHHNRVEYPSFKNWFPWAQYSTTCRIQDKDANVNIPTR